MTFENCSANSNPSPTRLLLDVTIAATTDLNTGIQRVVRKISKHSEQVARELELQCVPVVCHGDQLTPVGYDGKARWDVRIFDSIRRGWMGLHRGIAKLLTFAHRDADSCYLNFLSRLRKLLVPKTLVRGIGNCYRRLTGHTIRFESNDVLVLLDASWDLPLEQLLKEADERNVPVVAIVYDLIPVLHPEFHHQQLRKVFGEWLNRVVEHSELMIGISRTVSEDLNRFIREQVDSNVDQATSSGSSGQGPQLDFFRLGSDFSENPKSVAQSAPTNFVDQTQLERKRYYLSVGTVEPRKNHGFLLDSFEMLWQTGSTAQLLIVGKIGWMCDEIAERIRQHPELDQKLFFVDNATDEQLVGFYRNAKSPVFPSIVEGFGLPLVEAFQHRLPALASDTRIHREVAGENATYFSLENPASLFELLEEIESGQKNLVSPNFPSTSWRDSCRELLTKINQFLVDRRIGGQSGDNATAKKPMGGHAA